VAVSRANCDNSKPCLSRTVGSVLYEVGRGGGRDEEAVPVSRLDAEYGDAASTAQDACAGLDAPGADGAQEVDCEVDGDGVDAGFEQSENCEGRGAIKERDDCAAVEYAAHARQLLAHVNGEPGRAAFGPDELKAEQARVRNSREGFAQPREFVRRKLRVAHEP